MRRVLRLGVVLTAAGWLQSIGALDPKLWIDTVKREKQRIPGQIREAIDAGKRAAAQAEERLDREVRDAFGTRD